MGSLNTSVGVWRVTAAGKGVETTYIITESIKVYLKA